MGAPNLAYSSAMHWSKTLRWFRPPLRGLKKDQRKWIQGKLLFCYVSETKLDILMVPIYFFEHFFGPALRPWSGWDGTKNRIHFHPIQPEIERFQVWVRMALDRPYFHDSADSNNHKSEAKTPRATKPMTFFLYYDVFSPKNFFWNLGTRLFTYITTPLAPLWSGRA